MDMGAVLVTSQRVRSCKQVHILAAQTQRLPSPHPGHREQTDQRPPGRRPQQRGKRVGCPQKRGDLLR